MTRCVILLLDPMNFDRNKGEKSFIEATWGGVRNAILGATLVIGFGVLVLVTSIFSVAHGSSSEVQPVDNPPVVTQKVEYYLPYPGILPDSPLYKLKAARDRIVLWFTFDEQKKAEKELLYANKRIGAAVALADGGKMELAISTATKAEKYLESAVIRVNKLLAAGVDAKSLQLELEKATAKHKEILQRFDSF